MHPDIFYNTGNDHLLRCVNDAFKYVFTKETPMSLRIDEIPSLNAQLEEVTRQLASQVPPEALQMLGEFMKDLKGILLIY